MLFAFVALAVAGENLIVNGSFEEQGPKGAVHWSPTDGAVIGARSPASEVTWPTVDGARVLRLHGDTSTMSWTMIESAPIAVTGGTDLVLSGRMKTEGLKREGRQYDNCNLVVLFLDANGKRVGMGHTRVVAESQPWTDERARVRVPAAATTATVGAFLSKSGTAWFDDVKLEVADALPWITSSTEHYDFHWFAEAPISEEMQRANERALARLILELGVSPPPRVAYYRYASKQQKAELTGNGGNAHTDLRAIYTIWPGDAHEIVHILTQQWGETDRALLGEGIAVHASGNWQGRPVDDYARDLLVAGKIPPLSTLASTDDAFRGADSLVTYAAAGSFVGYLVRLKDMAAFKRVYVAGAPLDERLKAEYGKDLAALDAEWRASLAT
jgi:hypothetical protein